MSETRLGINIEAQDLTSAKIKTIQQYLRDLTKALGEATAAAQRQGLATSGAVKAIEGEIAAQTKLLGSLRASMDASESAARASARLGAASRISAAEYRKSAQEFETSAALILRAQRALDTRPQERVIGRFFNTAQLISAQRAAGGLSEGGMFDAAQILRAQRAVDSYTASLTKAESPGKALSSAQILAARRRVAELSASMETASNSARSFERALTHIPPVFDSITRGNRRQALASIGATFRDLGVSTSALLPLFGLLGGTLAITGLVRAAEHMGLLAQHVKAAATAAGLSIPEYSQLSNALQLLGLKANSADAALKYFAENTAKAIANPASRQAQAFQALGVNLAGVKSGTESLSSFLLQFADAWKNSADGQNKVNAGLAIFGRTLQNIAPLINLGSSGITELKNKAASLGGTLDEETQAALADTGLKAEDLSNTIRLSSIKAFIAWKPEIDAVIGSLKSLISWLGGTVTAAGSFANAIPAVNIRARNLQQQHEKDVSSFTGAANFFASIGLTPEKNVRTNLLGAHQKVVNLAASTPPFAQSGNREGGAAFEGTHIVGPIGVPKPHVSHAGGGVDKAAKDEYSDVLATQREAISNLQRQYELQSEMANAQFIGQRTTAKLGQANKELSPTQRAQEDYNAYKAAGEQKLAALQSFQAAEDAAYEKLIAEAMKVYGQDKAQYARAVGEKEAADQEFLVKHQQIINEINSHAMEIVTAHAAAVKEVVDQWGEAFDKMGDQIESSIGEAIKSAIYPMKPEYWYSSRQGQMGQPLIQAHRINPAMQIAGNLGEGLLGDLGKELQSSIMSSLAKSFSGGASSDFGQIIAKLIGAGTPGGIFGSGLGAVQKDTSEITFSASVTTFAAAVTAFAGATATSAAGSAASDAMGAASAVGSAGGIFGFLSKVPLLGSLFSGGAGAAGGAAADAAATVAAFSSGGIVPSAAGGWALGHFPGATPALLHSNEMVLPEHISTGLQGMINRGGSGGGDQHIHFHGPADAPSISKFFRDNFRQNSGAIRQMFRQNSLTPRSI